jgi:enterochelin esterase family protein
MIYRQPLSTLVCTFVLLLVAPGECLSAQQGKVDPLRILYPLTADSMVREGVPEGKVTEHEWLESKVYPGTKRRYSVYVPQQYEAAKPAALMVFQDGHDYANRYGLYRATVVMDNLIAKGEMPVTIGVFVDPGHLLEKLPEKRGWEPYAANRRDEYDALTGDYAQFLISEILPEVDARFNITSDPAGRAICGVSSGGICAFTAAWERPDHFSKVISHIGSYTNILHGDTYPGIIRKSYQRPIRVYLQGGSNDLDNEHGNWPLANKQMYNALKYRKYDVKFDFGKAGHDGFHGGAVLPDAMRWIWRDYPGVKFNRSAMPIRRTGKKVMAWWEPRHEAKLAELAVRKNVDLLMVGDSITHGWEKEGQAIWDDFYEDRNAFGIGFSGDQTEHVLWRLQNGEMDGITPKVAVVMIGTNNTREMRAAEDTAAGIERIVDEILLRSPDTKVLLLGIFPRDEQPDGEKRTRNREINKIIERRHDGRSVWYLDIGDRFLDEQGVLPKSVMGDFLHPSRTGYKIWAESMEPLLKQLLDE